MKAILLLEPDHFAEESLIEILKRIFSGGNMPEIISCQEENTCIKQIETRHADIEAAILNPVAPWSFPDENMPIPPVEVQINGEKLAGYRCLRKLASQKKKGIPFVLIGIEPVSSYLPTGTNKPSKTILIEKSVDWDVTERALQEALLELQAPRA